jgi:hypothetical protein
MAALALITTTDRKVNILQEIDSRPVIAGENLSAGDPVQYNSAGKVIKSKSDTSPHAVWEGIVTKTVKSGEPVTLLERGEIYGFDLSALAFGASVYLQDAGGLGTTAGTVSTVIAEVVPVHANLLGSTPDKVLKIRR